MIKVTFDVEYGIVSNNSMEETIQMVCKQLKIQPSQIKNIQVYNMNDLDIMMQNDMNRRMRNDKLPTTR